MGESDKSKFDEDERIIRSILKTKIPNDELEKCMKYYLSFRRRKLERLIYNSKLKELYDWNNE